MFHTMYVAILYIYMVSALSQSTAQPGVYLEFKGQKLNATSKVVLSEIGEYFAGDSPVNSTARGDALVCVTDNPMCCRATDGAPSTGTGFWILPDIESVLGPTVPYMGIYRSRGTGIVRLNRQSSSTYEGTGMFCCMLPDMSGSMQTLCVNVVNQLLPPTLLSMPIVTEVTTPTTTVSGGMAAPVIGAIVGILSVAVIIVIVVIVIIFSKRKSKQNSGTQVENVQTETLGGKNLSLDSVKPTNTNPQYECVDSVLPSKETAVYSEIQEVLFNRENSPIKEKPNNMGLLVNPYYSDIAPRDQIEIGTNRKFSPTRDSISADRQSEQMGVDEMYTVPYIVPKSTEISKGTEPKPGTEYSEIIRTPPPEIPQMSSQLEDYLKNQVLNKGADNSGYTEIDVIQNNMLLRPTGRSDTLKPLSRPLANQDMSENPLYEPANQSNNLISSDENVYADPTEPIAAAKTEENMENIYETIYKEPIQPSLFKAKASSSSIPTDTTTLCPFSSIYTLPEVSVNNGKKPLIISPDNIQEVQLLGVGNFGRVVLAKTTGLSLKDLKMSSQDDDKNVKIYVAVKMLKESVSKSVSELFEKEYKFMSKLNHPNVLRMLGVCTGDTPFIMMEYMEKGDLNQYLKKFNTVVDTESGGSHITTGTLVYMATQIASGMAYLAQKNFVHRDLATRNCLVGKGNVVKISDFGMSRNLYESHYYIIQGQAILPIRWMSTECFYGKFSAKSDVWAFGVTMWEIFTLVKEEPYFGLSDQEVVEDAIKGAGRSQLARPSACPIDVFRIMEECWVCEPSLRATFEDVFAQMSILNFKYGGN